MKSTRGNPTSVGAGYVHALTHIPLGGRGHHDFYVEI